MNVWSDHNTRREGSLEFRCCSSLSGLRLATRDARREHTLRDAWSQRSKTTAALAKQSGRCWIVVAVRNEASRRSLRQESTLTQQFLRGAQTTSSGFRCSAQRRARPADETQCPKASTIQKQCQNPIPEVFAWPLVKMGYSPEQLRCSTHSYAHPHCHSPNLQHLNLSGEQTVLLRENLSPAEAPWPALGALRVNSIEQVTVCFPARLGTDTEFIPVSSSRTASHRNNTTRISQNSFSTLGIQDVRTR